MRVTLLVFCAIGTLPFSFASCAGGPTQPATAPSASLSYPVTPPGVDPIDYALAQNAQRVAPDMQAEGAPTKLTLLQNAHQQMSAPMQQGRCYTILGSGPPGSTVALTLMAQDNKPIAQDAVHENSPVLGSAPLAICPTQTLALILDVTILYGAGVVGVQMYSKGGATPVASASVLPSASASVAPPIVEPVDELLKKQAATLAKGMEPDGTVTKQTLQEGGRMNTVATLQPGRCYTLLAVSPPDGVKDLAMVLLMPPLFTVESGKDTRTDNTALIGGAANPLCPIAIFPIPYRLDVTAKKGSGQVAVQMFSRAK